MNKELLKNPEVKEIAEAYGKEIRNRTLNFDLSINKNKYLWDDFVKSQEPEKDWEIISFRATGERYVSGFIEATLRENGRYLNSDTISGIGCYAGEEIMRNNSDFKIYSVRRKSDNQVFTVGDKVQTSSNIIEITHLRLSENGQIYANGDVLLYELKKAEPLFTTEDGKPVYKGTEFYVVFVQPVGSTPQWAITKLTGGIGITRPFASVLDFSTKEAAEEYILLNKPCLSISDMTNSGAIVKGSPQYNQLVKLTKEKQGS